VLEHIDDSLEALLRATVPLSATDVDVAFEAPDREWSAKLTRPTVNVFLWDIRRSTTQANSGLRTVTRDGVRVHQPALPVLELRYVVTAWTSDHGDERALLAGLLRSLLAHATIPREFLPASMAELDPPRVEIARAGEDHMDVFKALEGKVKPGINVVLSSEFDIGVFTEAGPPIETIETTIGRFDSVTPQFTGNGPDTRRRVAGEVLHAVERGAIGAVVRSSIDASHVNATGRFVLRTGVDDEITIETEPPLTMAVPATGGVRFE
jgi:Pvc16 N-terminal domain